MPVNKVCIVCGIDFKVPPSRVSSAMFCGVTCKASKSAEQYKEVRAKCACQWCNKEFLVAPSRVARGKMKNGIKVLTA